MIQHDLIIHNMIMIWVIERYIIYNAYFFFIFSFLFLLRHYVA